MARLNIILRRARTLVWTVLSILIIFSAVLVGVGKLLMPYSDRFQGSLESWLSGEFGQKVTLESFDGEWNAFGPRLSLRGLRIQAPGSDSGEVAISEAALDLHPLNMFVPGKALYNFLVIGADFRLVHGEDGRFVLSGLGVGGSDGDGGDSGLRDLIGIGELILENSSLQYVDEKRGVRLGLSQIGARVQLDGDSVALKLEAKLTDETSGATYGELDATGRLEWAELDGLQAAHWQVKARELLLASFQGRLPKNPFLPQEGRINAEFWCDWLAGSPIRARGVVDLKRGRLESQGRKILVEHLNTRLAWSYGGEAKWRVDFDELLYDDGKGSWTSPSIAVARNLDENLGLWISADYLPLDVPMRLARDIMAIDQNEWPAYLPGTAGGNVSGLELVLDQDWRIELARGTVRQARIAHWDRWPSLQGLNAEIQLQRGFGNVSLHAPQLQIDWPRMFAVPLTLALPGCEVDLAWGKGWQVNLRDCQILNNDIALRGDVLLAGGEGKPAVDLNVEMTRGKLGELSPYWPIGLMRSNVVDWLRHGLVDGEVTSGRALLHGDLDDWPFRNGEGRFEAIARVESAKLDYAAGWPEADGADVTARFSGVSMVIDGSIDDVGGVPVQTVTAEIENLKAPLLEVNYLAQSNLSGLAGFLLRSPLEKRLNTHLDQFEFSGRAATSGVLRIPLGKTAGELTLEGRVDLASNGFRDPGTGIALDSIHGRLNYTRHGVSSDALEAEFKGKPARLNLQGDQNSREKFRLDLAGTFTVQDILPGYLLEGYAEFDRVQGESYWLASIVVPALPPGEDPRVDLQITSDLQGVEVDLPEPLRKPFEAAWPIRLHYPLKGRSAQLDLELDNRVSLRLDLLRPAPGMDGEVRVERALVLLGGSDPGLPAPGLIRIIGNSASLDLDGWLDVVVESAKAGKGLSELKLERCELDVAELRFLDRLFGKVKLGLGVSDGDIKGVFSGADIDGQVVFSTDSGLTGSLVAEFERLALGDPVTSGVDMEANPGDLPALHLYARSFRYAGIEMGETRIEAYPEARGFHFEKVESVSDQLSFRASGNWSLQASGQRSDFNILITSESLGHLMKSLDLSTSLEGGQTMLRFNAWWPGSPAAFALSHLNGEIEFSVSRGQITNASAGGGRLLGLLSIQALPRRLSLDFRDVFDSGFDFEEAKGTFYLENGTARTDDVELSSSAAKITLSGSTDLVAQKYDQLMTVRPGVGNTLPIIGAIAGGPGGAAAGLALQGLLHESLGNAAQVQYTITGTWDDPLIEPLKKEDADG